MDEEISRMEVRLHCLDLAARVCGTPDEPAALLEVARRMETWVEEARRQPSSPGAPRKSA